MHDVITIRRHNNQTSCMTSLQLPVIFNQTQYSDTMHCIFYSDAMTDVITDAMTDVMHDVSTQFCDIIFRRNILRFYIFTVPKLFFINIVGL